MTRSHLIDCLASFVSMDMLELPERAVHIIRDSVIDTFGCILAGSQEEAPSLSRNAVVQISRGSSIVYGTSMRSDPESAAFLNSVAGHALEMDDWEISGNSHASVVLVPALLAASGTEPLGGREMTKAYACGFEVIARLGEAINFEHYAKGWHATSTLATIGAAAAISRLWKLDCRQTANALSLSVSMASGLTRQFGSHAKPLQAGFASQNGIRAARLAANGLTGQSHVLEGEQGYLALAGQPDRERHYPPFEKLGAVLAIEEFGQVIKPYPSCGYTHRIVDCAIKLAGQGIKPEDVQEIRLHLPDFHAAILPIQQPSNRREALFSLPFCAAMGLLQNGHQLDDLDRKAWTNPNVMRLISLTSMHPFVPNRPDLNYDPEQPDRMEVILRNGKCLCASTEYPAGSPQKPLSLPNLLAKFKTNAARFRDLSISGRCSTGSEQRDEQNEEKGRGQSPPHGRKGRGCRVWFVHRRLARGYRRKIHAVKFPFDLKPRSSRPNQSTAWKKPHRIFVKPMNGLFRKDIDHAFIDRVFDTMKVADQHICRILTKRGSLMRNHLLGRHGESQVLSHPARRIGRGSCTSLTGRSSAPGPIVDPLHFLRAAARADRPH